MRGASVRLRLALPALLASLALGCGGAGDGLPPTRGYLVLSLGGLRADHLGSYGYDRDVSPFLDSLAADGVRFERAIAQSPNSLTSLTTLFTGLYPREHGVFPPNRLLAAGLETLPERFARYGYRTAGFTENGLLGTAWRFHRGFEDFAGTDGAAGGDALARGLDLLDDLAPGERFFLFVQSEALAAPFAPPPPWDERLVGGIDRTLLAAAAAFDRLAVRDVNGGFRDADPRLAPALTALYDAGLARLDERLRAFFARLEARGLRDDLTIVITADRGQELLEHGRLGASQVYPESVHVPLLVLHPRLAPRAVAAPVGLVDLAPTLGELARMPPPERASGRSLVPDLAGASPHRPALAFSEALGREEQQALYTGVAGAARLYLRARIPQQRDGAWIGRSVAFDTSNRTLPFRIVSFRTVRAVTVRVDGRPLARLEARPRWGPATLSLPPGPSPRRVELAAVACESPKRLGLSADPRCLSFKLDGLDLTRAELFALAQDPLAAHDLSRERPAEVQELERLRDSLAFPPAEWPELIALTPERRRILESLGYLE